MTDKLKPQQLMTVEELVSLLAPKVHEPGHKLSYTKGELKKRVVYAIRHGKLISPNRDGRYELGTVVAWAQKKTGWADKFAGLPRTIVEQVEVRGTIGELTTNYVAPTNIEDAEHATRRMAMELAEAKAEISRLRPKEAKYEKYRTRQQDNAKQDRPRDKY